MIQLKNLCMSYDDFTKSLQVDPLDAVSSVKKKVERELGVSCELQRLVFKGSTLAGKMAFPIFVVI